MPPLSLAHRIGGTAPVAAALRRAHRLLLPDEVTVVVYHGLVDAPLPVPSPLFLSVRDFARQMEYLRRHFRVLHLEEALDPARPVAERPLACVTFDDGFASLRELALPVLERLALPATVYLVTDLVDTDGALWYTRLHQAICDTASAEVRLDGRSLSLRGRSERAAASDALQVFLKALPRARFGETLDELLSSLGAGGSRVRPPWPSMRILASADVRRMGRDDLVRFGSHTATHQILTRTDRPDVRREIGRSVAAVASLVRRPSRSFAYPNGGPADFDDGVIETLREAGVAWALTTIEGPNPRDVDPYRVRRYPVSGVEDSSRFVLQVHHARALLERSLAGGWLRPHDAAGGGRP